MVVHQETGLVCTVQLVGHHGETGTVGIEEDGALLEAMEAFFLAPLR
jgi:hypothetical protein